MVIAIKPTTNQLAKISASTLIHVTALDRLSSIVVDRTPSSLGENCTISLKAGQGWSVAPMKLFRDYSVLDLDLSNLKDWGRYLYFFVGEPSRWAILKNISSLRRWEDLQSHFGIIRVNGAILTAISSAPMFYRSDDNALVLRGGYKGPAAVAPLR